MISNDFKSLVLGSSKDLNPKDRKGPDWDLELADSFELKLGKRDEEWIVVEK